MTAQVSITVDNQDYVVPDGITVIQAMWHLGKAMTDRVGCLGGVCGACAISVRLPDAMETQTSMACQTSVCEGMVVTFLPQDGSEKVVAPLPESPPTGKEITAYYPETRRCIACRACNTICPQGIDNMAGVREAISGNFISVAERYTDCVMCGLCALVCDARIRPHRIGTYARRLSGASSKHLAVDLQKRVTQIESGYFESEWTEALQNPSQLLNEGKPA